MNPLTDIAVPIAPTMRSQFEALPEMIEQSVVSYGREEFFGLADWATFEAGVDKGLAIAARLVRDTLSSAKEPQIEGWRDIATAPKDGSKIDLLDASQKRPHRAPDCYWHRKAQRWMCKHHDREGYSAIRLPFKPTHWMPLPALPSSEASS